ncbi:MAG: VWA domain-containing protein, partial [Hyphomicrobiales bacterium]
SPLDLPEFADRVIVASSISKSHAAPGFRSGWCVGPADFCAQSTLAPILPLTSDWTALTNAINSMTPVGNTNVTIGANWGMATLTPGVPFTEAKPFATPRLQKYMILLTDGENTQNRFTTNGSAIDARTTLACQTAKDAGIRIYTVRVINGDRTLLQNCATTPSMYYEVSSASQLTPVFQQIAREISQIRLTQ